MPISDKSRKLLKHIAREGDPANAEHLSRAGFGERAEVQESLDELESTGHVARGERDYDVNDDAPED